MGHHRPGLVPPLSSSIILPPSAPLAPPWLLTKCDILHLTCLKLPELENAVLLGWVALALHVLPLAASPLLEHPLEAVTPPPALPAAHPQPQALITQATIKAASCKSM